MVEQKLTLVFANVQCHHSSLNVSQFFSSLYSFAAKLQVKLPRQHPKTDVFYPSEKVLIYYWFYLEAASIPIYVTEKRFFVVSK